VLEPRILRGAAAVTAASAPIIEAAARFGVQARRVPLGVDLDRWPVQLPRARAAGEARLLHVASLNRVKDQTTLLGAMRLLADRGVPFHLDIVGEDTLGGEVQALAARLGLGSQVHFHGFMTQAQMRALVCDAHLNLVSSRHEAGPLVLLEAAVCGVPTVGTDVGHLAEWQPEAAVAVPVANAGALAGAIMTLLSDEPRRMRLAHAAQARALAEDADATARGFFELYEAMVVGP
jgi:glycosyltransferase involved in cell wall biosynthesis